VFGDSRPWLGAVLVPSTETLESGDENVRVRLQSAVDRVNNQVGVGERIRKFVIQEDICSTENGLLTPTQKVKRTLVLEKHSETIAGLY